MSAKNFEKKKYLSLRRIFIEYTKNKEKTQNFSKETALIAIIGMLTSREKLTQEKSIMLDRRLDSTTYNDNVGNFTTKCHSFAEKTAKNYK